MKPPQKSNNNMLAMIAIGLIIASISSNYLIYRVTDEITGKAVAGQVSFCIWSASPSSDLIYPPDSGVINGTINMSAIGNTTAGDKWVQNINFEYRLYHLVAYNFLYNDTNDGDAFYNFSFNSSNYAEGACSYVIRATVYLNATECGDTTAEDEHVISINNIDQEPDWTEFYNNITTNFTLLDNISRLHDYFDVADVVVGIPSLGLINYSGLTIIVDDVNISNLIEISWRTIQITDSYPCDGGNNAELVFYNISLLNPAPSLNGEICAPSECNAPTYVNNIFKYTITNHRGNYSVIENITTTALTWDQTDNYTRYVNENLTFFANWTIAGGPLDGQSVNGSDKYCEISFNYTANSSFTTPVLMNFSNSSLLYEYTTTFPLQGTHPYLVFCNASGSINASHNLTGNFTITNRPPAFPAVFNTSFPNLTWNEDSTLSGIDMDDYFTDPDGDVLTYTFQPNPVLNINITFANGSNILTLTPAQNWYGNRTVTFYATDPFGATNYSNLVLLEVIDVPEPVPPPPGGGGGGGGSTPPPPPIVVCVENWWCNDWGACLPSNIRKRDCFDATECGTIENRPNLTEYCEYIPTCYDNLKNQGEEQVDCGGPCPACPSCSDRIKNQGEEQVDCGGPCPACPTCQDGILNQGEDDIDCGGPCPACPSCNDNIKNQGEERVDCGGPCPECESPAPLPTCDDGIRNQGEEDIDCGGPCGPCEKANLLWPLISLWFLILLIALFLLRDKIKKWMTKTWKWLLAYWKKLHEKKPIKPSLFTIEMEALAKLKDLQEGIGSYNMEDLFGEYKLFSTWFVNRVYDVEFEFTLQELYNILQHEKCTRELMIRTVGMYQKIEDISYRGKLPQDKEFEKMVKDAKLVVEETVLFKIAKLHPMEFIHTMLADMRYEMHLKRVRTAEKLYFKVVEVYDTLTTKDKKHVYGRMKRMHKMLINLIKEESLHPHKAQPPDKKPPKQGMGSETEHFTQLKKNIKVSASIILVLVSALLLTLNLGDANTPTGFVVSKQPSSGITILKIPDQEAIVGEYYTLDIHAAHPNKESLIFIDSTDIFEISDDGTVAFMPHEEHIGDHTIIIGVGSGDSISAYSIMRLRVIEK